MAVLAWPSVGGLPSAGFLAWVELVRPLREGPAPDCFLGGDILELILSPRLDSFLRTLRALGGSDSRSSSSPSSINWDGSSSSLFRKVALVGASVSHFFVGFDELAANIVAVKRKIRMIS